MAKQKDGGRKKRRSDQRKKEKESKNKERILCLEIEGELIGIDLNRDDDACESPPKPCSSCGCTCNLKSLASPPPVPPLAPICFRLKLGKNRLPNGMRHVKIDDNKVYLLGGACFDPEIKGFSGYSDSVYEFNADRIKNAICKNNSMDLLPEGVLRSVTTLNEPKFALVANLGGTNYILHHSSLLYMSPNIHVPCFEPKSFERFDPITKSWHQAPAPLFGEGELESEGKSKSEMFEKQNEEAIRVYQHLVVEDKLLLFCHDLVYVFSHLTQKWETSSELYTSIQESFKRCGQDVPNANAGLWLCDFGLSATNAGGDSLGVLLGMKKVRPQNLYGLKSKDSPCEYRAYAYAMSKTTCQLQFYQRLDEVFSGMIPTPSTSDCEYSELKVTHHLLDLGKGVQKNQRRVCAIFGYGLTKRISYLFISIFDVQMRYKSVAPLNSANSCEFLKVSTVKKLVFQLHMNHKKLIPLDAFIL